MNIEEKKSTGLTKDFNVTIPSKTIAEKISAWLAEKAKHIRLDGFRPGKVPFNIVEQRYSLQAEQDVLEDLIKEATQKIVKDHGLRLAVQPSYENVNQYAVGKDFSFSVSMESFPEIKLKDFKDIKIDNLVVEIGEKEVEDALKSLSDRHTKFKTAADSHKIKEGDQVKIDLVCTEGKKQIKSFSGKGITIVVGKNEVGLNFVEEKLSGHKKGETVTVDHTFEADYADKTLAGKTAKFEAKIIEVSEPQKTEINEAFAKEMGCEDLKDLRAKIKESLQKDSLNLTRLYHKRHVLDAMAEVYKFDLPNSMVKREFDNIWNRLQDEITQAKADGSFEEDDDRPEAELKKEYESIASRRVRLGLVIAEVAKAHTIRVTPEMARNAIFREAMRYPGQEKDVIKFYRDNPQMIEQITSPILEDLVVDFILTKATLKETKVTTKQLAEKLKGVLPGYGEEEQTEKKKSSKAETKTAKPKKKSESEAA
ncbi:MAG: trigger factor [Alphaproteobacteria bacterium]|nr:trigger factor [Alphaproteobacteria bacterium]